ncbi:hypothetical protein QQ045_030548 [Rhodiola kirilowii]
MGDFNEIAFSWEMESKRFRQLWQMNNFRSCLEDCDLVDLEFRGVRFTYSNRRKDNEEFKARLDRAVANAAWRHMFPNVLVRHGFANCSDHVPVVVYVNGAKLASNQYLRRFEPMWLRHKCFKEVLRKSWAGQGDRQTIASKLKACMEDLTQLNGLGFGNIKEKVKMLKERIQELRNGPRTEESANHEAILSGELDEWMEREELFWRQRSRAEWLKFGDRNTSFFHAKASQRRRKNDIDKLKDHLGEFCDLEEGIVSIVISYFTNIFHSQVNTQDGSWAKGFDHIPRLVSEEMNDKLKPPFTEGEVKRALFQMHPTKVQGLDGFSALFFQSNWHIVGSDVTREVKVAERVEDLRPISLCTVVMKIITKALANRLKEVLPAIIAQTQSAFIGGRLITDNILIAHEASHFIRGIHKQKNGYISMKLDMSKAYDRVEWYFLERMMAAMCFAQEWIRKIMICVKTVSYKVRVNGSITEEIIPSRGLRQGDPISPYLFLICAEWLTYTLNKYQEIGLIKGIKICRGAPVITHLMFADDSLLLLNARKDSLG